MTIICEHYVRKINYSTNKVQESYMTIWEQFDYQHFTKLPQSNFPNYTNSLTFPGFQEFQKSDNPE